MSRHCNVGLSASGTGGYRVHGNSLGEWFPNPYFDPSP
jgi:hypothetical protein